MNEVKKKQLNPTVLLLIGVGGLVLSIWSAKYIFITALFLPFLSAYMTARLEPGMSVVYYAAAGALCYLLLGGAWLVCWAMILLSGLLTAIAVRRKLSVYEGTMLSCAGWICAILAVVAFCYLRYDSDPLTLIVEKIRSAMEAGDAEASFGYLWLRTLEMMSADSMEEYSLIMQDATQVLWGGDMQVIRDYVLTENSIATINNYIALTLPSLCMQIGLLGGLFSYLLTRVQMKRRGMEVAPIAKFKNFKLPVRMTTPLALFYIAGVLALYFFDLPATLQMVCCLLVDSLGAVFSVQAVTLIHWILTLRSRSKGATTALSIVIPMVCALPGINALPWLGFFEMIFKLRYRTIVRKPQQ